MWLHGGLPALNVNVIPTVTSGTTKRSKKVLTQSYVYVYVHVLIENILYYEFLCIGVFIISYWMGAHEWTREFIWHLLSPLSNDSGIGGDCSVWYWVNMWMVCKSCLYLWGCLALHFLVSRTCWLGEVLSASIDLLVMMGSSWFLKCYRQHLICSVFTNYLPEIVNCKLLIFVFHRVWTLENESIVWIHYGIWYVWSISWYMQIEMQGQCVPPTVYVCAG